MKPTTEEFDGESPAIAGGFRAYWEEMPADEELVKGAAIKASTAELSTPKDASIWADSVPEFKKPKDLDIESHKNETFGGRADVLSPTTPQMMGIASPASRSIEQLFSSNTAQYSTSREDSKKRALAHEHAGYGSMHHSPITPISSMPSHDCGATPVHGHHHHGARAPAMTPSAGAASELTAAMAGMTIDPRGMPYDTRHQVPYGYVIDPRMHRGDGGVGGGAHLRMPSVSVPHVDEYYWEPIAGGATVMHEMTPYGAVGGAGGPMMMPTSHSSVSGAPEYHLQTVVGPDGIPKTVRYESVATPGAPSMYGMHGMHPVTSYTTAGAAPMYYASRTPSHTSLESGGGGGGGHSYSTRGRSSRHVSDRHRDMHSERSMLPSRSPVPRARGMRDEYRSARDRDSRSDRYRERERDRDYEHDRDRRLRGSSATGSSSGDSHRSTTRRGGSSSRVFTSVGATVVDKRSGVEVNTRALARSGVSLRELCEKGIIAKLSVDQHGSRYIQTCIESAPLDVRQMLFAQVRDESICLELCEDVFGNYVIQKLFDHGTPQMVRELSDKLFGRMLALTKGMYSCRVVQKALECVELARRVSLIRELEAHVIECIRDQNGNHVIQKAIEEIPTERLGFVVKALLGDVVAHSTHPYGCRVLQRLLERTPMKQKLPVLVEVLKEAHFLARDQYGNYVMQHVLEFGDPDSRNFVIELVCDRMASLSKHKFGSNVVEKAFIESNNRERDQLIDAMLGITHGERDRERGGGTATREPALVQMVRDQYANYVIQKTLEVCTEAQRNRMIDAMLCMVPNLRKLMFGKHIIAKIERLTGERMPFL